MTLFKKSPQALSATAAAREQKGDEERDLVERDFDMRFVHLAAALDAYSDAENALRNAGEGSNALARLAQKKRDLQAMYERLPPP